VVVILSVREWLWFLLVGWNKLRAVPAVEYQNLFGLPELRGACSSLLSCRLKNSQPRAVFTTRYPAFDQADILNAEGTEENDTEK